MSSTSMFGVFEIGSSHDINSDAILETFWRSGVHGEIWPKTVYAIVTCKMGNAKRRYGSQNTLNGDHAETKMMNMLRESAEKGSLGSNQTVVMHVNYSPCHACSAVTRSLVEGELGDVRLEVAAASLYKINRASCRSAPRDHVFHRPYAKADHDRNVQGLRDLQDAGVLVRTFNSRGRQDWNTLTQHVLHVQGCSYKGSKRKEEDEKLRVDLDTLLEGATGKSNAATTLTATRQQADTDRRDVIRAASRGSRRPVDSPGDRPPDHRVIITPASELLGDRPPDHRVIIMPANKNVKKTSSCCRRCSIL